IIPQVARYLISQFGWRHAYFGLGIAVVIVAWVPVSIFVREPPELEQRAAWGAGTDVAAALPGTPASEASKTWRFWMLTIAFFLAVMAINGTLTHVVALLTDRGVSLRTASGALRGRPGNHLRPRCFRLVP